MATLANLRTAVRLRVQDPDSIKWTNAQIDEVINQAVREMSSVLRTFVEEATIGIVAGQIEVDIADFLEMIRITRSDGYPLYGPIDYNDLKFHRNNEGAEPIMWYKLGNTIGLYPAASTSYNLDITYIAFAPALSGDSDVPNSALGPFADMFIIARAAQELLLTDPDLEAAQAFGDLAIKYLIEAQSSRNQSNNTRGPVMADSRESATWPHYL